MDDRLVRAAGTARERGESIGAAAGERIRALLTAQDREHRDRDGLSLHGWLPAARRYEPLVREHAPVTAAEMAGMAAGAGLLEDELLLLACAYEKYMGAAPAPARAPAPATDGHCTALGAAGDATVAGGVICGQNNDELMADDVRAAQRFLSDHGSRHAICQHPKPDAEAPGKTLASMVFEPAAGTMHLAFGNGCEEPYTAYRFDR